MPAEDHDRLFENALARHLRADAAAGDSACLDTELLAAYHEGMLSPEEMSAAKDHLVSCPRCQEVMAQLETTQHVHDLQRGELQNRADDLVTVGVTSRSKSDEVSEQTPLAAAPVVPAEKKQTSVAEFHVKKSFPLRWAAPAGAIAAGLLLWIGIRDFRSPPKQSKPATQIADNRSDAVRTPEFPAVEPESASKEKSESLAREELKEQRPTAPPSVSLRDEMRNSPDRAESSARSNAGKDKKVLAPAPLALPQSASGPQSGERISATDAGKASAKTEKADAAAQTPALDSLQRQTRNEIQTAEGRQQVVGGAAGTGGGAMSPGPPAAPSAATTAQAQTTTTEVGGAPSLLKKGANRPAQYSNALSNAAALPMIAAAPGGQSIWRFGEHGAIGYSGDGGRTWESQSAAVTANLTSGSAPSKKICWIAGTGGTLLRTTDSGKHWQLLTTPISADLGGVHATDAQHASIWDLANRMSYETSDGGASWTRTANE